MKAIVVLVISVIGSSYCDVDFRTLLALISIALDIYERYSDYTHDKTTKR